MDPVEVMRDREERIPLDLLRRSRVDRTVATLLGLYVRGDLSFEAMLVKLAVALSEQGERQRLAMVDQINLCTCRIHRIRPA